VPHSLEQCIFEGGVQLSLLQMTASAATNLHPGPRTYIRSALPQRTIYMLPSRCERQSRVDKIFSSTSLGLRADHLFLTLSSALPLNWRRQSPPYLLPNSTNSGKTATDPGRHIKLCAHEATNSTYKGGP
jgi:hypothetical protein